jgi:hypothetical protein
MTDTILPLDRSRRQRAALPRPTTKVDIHLHGCACEVCEPYVPSMPRFTEAAGSTLGAMFCGMAITTIVVAIYDWATAGPGLGSVFGL